MTACLSFFAKLVTLQLPGLGFDEIFAVCLCVFFWLSLKILRRCMDIDIAHHLEKTVANG